MVEVTVRNYIFGAIHLVAVIVILVALTMITVAPTFEISITVR